MPLASGHWHLAKGRDGPPVASAIECFDVVEHFSGQWPVEQLARAA